MKAMLNRSVFAACNLAQTLVTEKKKMKKNIQYSEGLTAIIDFLHFE